MVIRICAKCNKLIPGPGISHVGKWYHQACFTCAYCGSPIKANAVIYKDALYHTECNPASAQCVCAYCRKPIADVGYKIGDRHYHQQCYHLHIEKTCCICREPIHSEYYCDPWGNYSHTSHNGRKPSFCFACGCIISKGGRPLGESADLCETCASTAVTTDAAVESCRKQVISVFKTLSITGVPEDIPVKLVRYDQMEGALGRIHYHNIRDPKRADFHIQMTYGLQELFFRGVLAHELLHSWLVLKGREVTDDECEGFCNLGKAFIYTKEDTPLAHYLLKRMYNNADLVYGAGYRLQKERYEKLGWEGLLNSLRFK